MVDKKTEVVYWGSCKMNARKQDPCNLMAHVVSYFNNRGWQLHDYFTYRHVFLFISPTFSEEDRKSFSELPQQSVEALNAILSTGRSQTVKNVCENKLSDYANAGAGFAWWPPEQIQKPETKPRYVPFRKSDRGPFKM